MRQVLLPPRTRVWNQKEWYLYFDPHNFLWVRVNENGRFVLEGLRCFKPVHRIAEEVSQTFAIGVQEADEKVNAFIDLLVDAGFLHIDEYCEREPVKFEVRSFAYAVYLHLTNACNLKCPYCYNKDDREYKANLVQKGKIAPPLSTDEYKSLIARLVELGAEHLLFTGGEPLMRTDCMELIRFTRSLNKAVKIEVLTNAILIKDEVAEQLCDLADVVTISLDGHERHIHEHYRGHNTFAPTVKGIRNLVEARRRRGQSRPYIATVPALTDRNIGFKKEIFEFSLDDLGVDGLAPILFQAGDHQELSLKQIPGFDVWVEAQKRTSDYLAARSRAMGSSKSSSAVALAARNHCGVGYGEFSIDPSGFVYPCQSLHFDEFIAGNVRDADVGEIYNTSNVMRAARGTVVDRLKVCKCCDLKYVCNGGCRATAYNIYRDFEAHNEMYCRYLERIAVDRMWAACNPSHESTEGVCT